MNRPLFAGILALTGAWLLSGCERRLESTTADSEVEVVPQFSAKRGLLLPEQTRRSLGLKLADVTERKLSSTLDLALRVYRKDATAAFASVAVPPEQSKLLKVGQSIETHPPDGARQTARVTGVSGQWQQAIGSVEVLVEISGSLDALAVGAFVPATALIQTGEKVVAIPRSAVLGCSEGNFVYTVSGEHLVRTAVKLGLSNTEWVEITDGLYAGDQVVLQPVVSLWMTELAAVKGGQACCPPPPKGK